MQFNLTLENIKYIKIFYDDTEGLKKCAKAVVKRIGEKEIFACAKFVERLNLRFPQKVTLNFICANGVYQSETTLKFVHYEESYIFFLFATPQNVEYQQNREFFRVNMTENAILSFKKHDKVFVVKCKTQDISAGGVKLVLEEPIEQPKDVSIELLFEDKSVLLGAEFVRFDNQNNILQASFKYTKISERDRDIIAQKCIQKQLENKRNTLK